MSDINYLKHSDKDWQAHAEQALWQLVDGAESTIEKLDKDGCVHTLTSKAAPNIDAVKFALKNKSKGEWADKTEVTHTQVNLNLNATYNEVKALLEQQKQQQIAQKQQLSQINYVEAKNVKKTDK